MTVTHWLPRVEEGLASTNPDHCCAKAWGTRSRPAIYWVLIQSQSVSVPTPAPPFFLHWLYLSFELRNLHMLGKDYHWVLSQCSAFLSWGIDTKAALRKGWGTDSETLVGKNSRTTSGSQSSRWELRPWGPQQCHSPQFAFWVGRRRGGVTFRVWAQHMERFCLYVCIHVPVCVLCSIC